MGHSLRHKSYSEHGNVVFLAEGFCSTRDRFGRLGGNGCGALEAEELALHIASLHDAIGEKGERVAGREPADRLRVLDVRRNAERESGIERDLLAGAVGRQVAGVGKDNVSRGVEVGAEAGGKAPEAIFDKDAVKVNEEPRRSVHLAARRGTQEQCTGHGSRGTLPADVANEEALVAFRKHAAKVEIAAHLAHGKEGDAKLEARRGGT